MSDDLVWDQTLDQGQFRGRVERISDYEGRLIVSRTSDDLVLLQEDVGLMYGARFGPDVSDLMSWQQKTVDAVDAHVGQEASDE